MFAVGHPAAAVDACRRCACTPILGSMSETLKHATVPRLTTTASGGGCACKIPPGELEEAVAQLAGQDFDSVIVGVDDGDDAAAVRMNGGTAILSTEASLAPACDSPSEWR